MGLIAIVSSATSSLSLTSPIGAGIGSVFVVVALLALLAYQNILEIETKHDARVRSMLYAVAAPLGVAFAGIVLFQSLQVI